ncbi:MAG TPA: methylated-DNA--[protein]-cysteine S-methyltransferase [Streptosporangiaceae bacterium]
MTGRAGHTRAVVHTVLATSLGELTVVREEAAVTGLYFPRHWPRPDRTAFGPRSDEGLDEVARQLGEYLEGDRTEFDLPLKVRGSEFDRRVWDLIGGVPYGQTTTYGKLAHSLGAGTDPRDVGAAVGRNPVCVIIPCHRVVGATGRLTGYAGGLDRKRALLEIERADARGLRFGPPARVVDHEGCISRSMTTGNSPGSSPRINVKANLAADQAAIRPSRWLHHRRGDRAGSR